jgi:hypothetical protein
MALGSIKLTIEGYNMFSMLQSKEEEKTWTLGPQDRCDKCGAEALVKVSGISGELFFCGHDYNKIMDNAVGYDSMMKFAISIVDEREKIN